LSLFAAEGSAPLQRPGVINSGPMKRYWCYIMSNKSRRLYVGFTDDLPGRVVEHREKYFPGSFTARYIFDILVYYEQYSHAVAAKVREKEIKGWRREKKLKLILKENPDWADLSLEWQDNPGWSLMPSAQRRLRRRQQ
jgi:putative endonuclease